MPEIAQTTSTEQGEAATAGSPAETPPTVEEVEAIWAKRMSGKDRAHAAEVTELRRQLEAAKSPVVPIPNETPEQARIRELEARLADTEKQRAVDIRKARFPHAADYLGDALAAADEAKLAGLEALLVGDEPAPSAPRVPNAAPRQAPAQPKSYEDMSREELREALKRISGPYADSLKERYG